jgi:hypothetical protein
MPYISEHRRQLVTTQPEPKHGVAEPLGAGELVYQLTVVIEQYREIHGTKFATINDIRGALDSTKDEFNRQIAHPYEDEKLQQNGDVYDRSGTRRPAWLESELQSVR